MTTLFNNAGNSSASAAEQKEVQRIEQQDEKIKDFIAELSTIKEMYKQQVWSILTKYGSWLASMDGCYLTEVIIRCTRQGLATEEQIRKAVIVAKKEMPLYIARNKRTTVGWWEGLPTQTREVLSNPTSKIAIKRGNSIDIIPVSKIGSMSREETKKIIDPDHPELGILKPDHTPKDTRDQRKQTFWDIEEISVIGANLVIVSSRNNVRITSRTKISDISRSNRQALSEALGE